jgi:hypothetical protein
MVKPNENNFSPRENDTAEPIDLFRALLEDAPEIVGKKKKEMLFPCDLDDDAWNMLKERYGFNVRKMGKVAVRYSIKDTNGKIIVKLFQTNKDGVFVGRYKHPDGSLHWSLRPKEFETKKNSVS